MVPSFHQSYSLPPCPPSCLAPSLISQTDPNPSKAAQLRAALRGGRTPQPRGFGEALPKSRGASSRLVTIELFTCPKGISRGRLGSWLSALTLPLAWPGSKGFTAFFGLIVGVSVESSNVCRLSKVPLCLSPPSSSRPAPPRTALHAGPGVPATRTPHSQLPLPPVFTPFCLHPCPSSPAPAARTPPAHAHDP